MNTRGQKVPQVSESLKNMTLDNQNHQQNYFKSNKIEPLSRLRRI